MGCNHQPGFLTEDDLNTRKKFRNRVGGIKRTGPKSKILKILEATWTNCLIKEKCSFHVGKKKEVAATFCVIKQYAVTCVPHVVHVIYVPKSPC